jgi:hypothetical protein
MRFPFRDHYDDLFKSSSSPWRKIAGGFCVGSLVCLGLLVKLRDSMPVRVQARLLVAFGLCGALAASGLSRKDHFENRRKQGLPIHPIDTFLFGAGFISFIFWSIIGIILTVIGLTYIEI